MTIDLSLPSSVLRAAARASNAVAAAERELARRVAEGDPDAVALLYDRYAPSLHRLLVALLGSAADAEDALQEVFVRLVSGRIGQVRDLRAYLFTAARHEAYSTLRRRRREESLKATAVEAHAASVAVAPDGLDWMGLLQRLPVEQREVIALKVFEDLTFAEIAALVKASPNTVASRYRYGIEQLRAWCAEEEDNGT
ncbi:MAG: RNA polymerase sigma factor [Armatimonadota bacterium]|nr:RNA polymerase sigma factor [Armatimonadota bacterium]